MSIETLTLKTRKPGPFPPGRRCDEPGCITVLCTYDFGPKCFACAASKGERKQPTQRVMEEVPVAA